MTYKTEVTQADRDAANEIFISALRQTERNDNWLLAILAKHRLAGERAGMERAAGIVEDVGDAYVEPTQRDYDRREGCYDAAQAIRAQAGEAP